MPQEPQRKRRLHRPALDDDEDHEQQQRDGQGDEGAAIPPAVGAGTDHAVDECRQRTGADRGAEDVDATAHPGRLGQHPRGVCQHQETDGHVHQEDPAPRGGIGEYPPSTSPSVMPRPAMAP